jgi:hypothetical protein
MNRLKNEFALSDIEVVLKSPTRGISIKYVEIHDSRISNLLDIHAFSLRPYLFMRAFHHATNSSPLYEPHTQAFKLVQNNLSFLVSGPTFSGKFSIICHMHDL